MKKTLHLNLKKEWFDMIKSGEKTEEYREVKQYWFGRFINYLKDNTYTTDLEYINWCLNNGRMEFKNFDTITFSNGYAKDRPQFEIELKSIEIKEGNSVWGAEPGVKYFALSLGRII